MSTRDKKAEILIEDLEKQLMTAGFNGYALFISSFNEEGEDGTTLRTFCKMNSEELVQSFLSLLASDEKLISLFKQKMVEGITKGELKKLIEGLTVIDDLEGLKRSVTF